MRFSPIFLTLALIAPAATMFAHNDNQSVDGSTINEVRTMQWQIEKYSWQNWGLKLGYIPVALISGYVGFKLGRSRLARN